MRSSGDVWVALKGPHRPVYVLRARRRATLEYPVQFALKTFTLASRKKMGVERTDLSVLYLYARRRLSRYVRDSIRRRLSATELVLLIALSSQTYNEMAQSATDSEGTTFRPPSQVLLDRGGKKSKHLPGTLSIYTITPILSTESRRVVHFSDEEPQYYRSGSDDDPLTEFDYRPNAKPLNKDFWIPTLLIIIIAVVGSVAFSSPFWSRFSDTFSLFNESTNSAHISWLPRNPNADAPTNPSLPSDASVQCSVDNLLKDSRVFELLEQLVEKRVSQVIQKKTRLQEKTLLRDFALDADGGAIECTLTSGCSRWARYVYGDSSTRAIAEDNRIGQCWLTHPSNAQLGVVLAEPIYPTHITIDHAPIQAVADVGEAPRTIVVWGMVDGGENLSRYKRLTLHLGAEHVPHPLPAVGDHTIIPLASFEYDISQTPSQTFPVYDYIRHSGIDFAIVILQIRTNWGSEKTCLYRIRVHGNSYIPTFEL